MMKELNAQNQEDPVIDWELGLKLASNKRSLAEEMLTLLTEHLTDEVVLIKQLNHSKKYTELQQRLHRLRGAVSYCGAPRLKKAIAVLENALKQENMDLVSDLFEQFEIESSLLLKAVASTKGKMLEGQMGN